MGMLGFVDRWRDEGNQIIERRKTEWVLKEDSDDKKVWKNQFNDNYIILRKSPLFKSGDRYDIVIFDGYQDSLYPSQDIDSAMKFIKESKQRLTSAFHMFDKKRKKKSTKPKSKRKPVKKCKCKVK